MKIALIYPPVLNSIKTTLPDFVNENEGYFPPLGIMYIASYLKAYQRDCEVLIIDSVAEKLDHGQIAARVADFKAEIVGISCWTFSLIDALATARQIKKSSPCISVCLGGPHVNIYPRETLFNDCVDFVITEDGERAFSELISQMHPGGNLQSVPNLYYKRFGKIMRSGLSYAEKELDVLPYPDRRLTDINKYSSIMDNEGLITTMITSRGCPFNCSFCFQRASGWRSRSVSNIVGEMKECIKIGISNFFIFDETFTVSKKRIMELCLEIKRNKLDIIWSCRSRVDTIDEEVMDNLKDSGCKRISFGVEAASTQVLRRLNKQITIKRASEIFRLAKRKGIITLADFMVGCPDERWQQTKQTIRLAKKLNPDFVQFSLFTLFPATKLYEEALKEGVIESDVWHNYAVNPRADFKPPLWNLYTEKQANRILVMAYQKFYLRFSYILKCLSSITSLNKLKVYARAALSLLRTAVKE